MTVNMMILGKEWDDFKFELNFYKEYKVDNLEYRGALDNPVFYPDGPDKGIAIEQIESILADRFINNVPHGLALLEPIPINEFPIPPAWPTTQPKNVYEGYDLKYVAEEQAKIEHELHRLRERFNAIEEQKKKLLHSFEDKRLAEIKPLEILRQGCLNNEITAIRRLMEISYIRHPLPAVLLAPIKFDLDFKTRVALCEIQIPDFSKLKVFDRREVHLKWRPVSSRAQKINLETILYTLCIRAAYLVAKSDAGDWFNTVAVNAHQSWHDPATGECKEGIIASLQVLKTEMLNLQITHIDPKSCFRHLKGISTPSIDRVAPVRPIFVMDTADNRIIENRNVTEQMDDQANLAAMPWDDFEQLVRQLFEWEFGRNGVEVKVTRASRDRGVDAIMFDPDPMRGGKYVLQAKRYTRQVDVAAVRDLYGTVVNEGANRGILVTTSGYGPDSYEFAKNKPISLVDGANLVAMLSRHGRKFRIDLEEARRLNLEDVAHL